MTSGPERRYFDSNAIIHYVYNDPDAGPVVEALLQEAAAGEWRVVVSAVSVVEVTRPRFKSVDPAKQATILAFFEQPYIYIRDLDFILAEKAHNLLIDYLWLHTRDAAHLAAAIDTGCGIFYTYETEIIDKFNGEHGLLVQRPEMPKKPELSDLPLFQPSNETGSHAGPDS
jgi:predicted nucleic acid-binding protein